MRTLFARFIYMSYLRVLGALFMRIKIFFVWICDRTKILPFPKTMKGIITNRYFCAGQRSY